MKKLLLLLPIALFMYAKPSLDADYDRGEELMLVERTPISRENKYELFEFPLKPYPLHTPLFSIYWNSNNNQYYYAKDGSRLTKTNGLTYKLDPKKEQEPSFIGEPQDLELVYAGYISTNQRLYIDKRDKQQYIKTLEPIHDRAEDLTPRIRTNDSNLYILYFGFEGTMGTHRDCLDGTWILDNYAGDR